MARPLASRLVFAALLLAVAAVALLSSVPASADACAGSDCTSVDDHQDLPSHPENDPCLLDAGCGGGASQTHSLHGCGGLLADALLAGSESLTVPCTLSAPAADAALSGVTAVGRVERPPRWMS